MGPTYCLTHTFMKGLGESLDGLVLESPKATMIGNTSFGARWASPA